MDIMHLGHHATILDIKQHLVNHFMVPFKGIDLILEYFIKVVPHTL